MPSNTAQLTTRCFQPFIKFWEHQKYYFSKTFSFSKYRYLGHLCASSSELLNLSWKADALDGEKWKNVKVIFQIPSVIWKSISQLNGMYFDNDLAWMQGPMAAEIARFMSLWLICSANAVFKEFRRVHGILSTELKISAQNMHLCKSRPKIKYYDWFWWEKDIPV